MGVGAVGRMVLWVLAVAVVAMLLLVVRPREIVEWSVRRLCLDASARIEEARWEEWGTLVFRGVRIPSQGLAAQSLRVGLSPAMLLKGRWRELVVSVEIQNPEVRLDLAEARSKMERAAPEGAEDSLGAIQGIRLPSVKIRGGQLVLEGLGPAIRSMALPVEFDLVQLPGPDDQEPRWRARLGEAQVHSPFDPLAPVFAWEAFEMEFTLSGLWHQRFERVSLIAPELFVGPDLFWVIDFARKQAGSVPAGTAKKAPWTVGRFDVISGRVTLTPTGQPALQLPLVFEAAQEGLVISSLEELRIKSAVRIPAVTLDYPEYQLHLGRLKGTLEFALPRGDPSANNLVNLVTLDEVRWRQLEAQKLWGSATFDARGLYLSYGAEAYKGYLNGNVTVSFQDMSWKAGIGFSGWDAAKVTAALRPEVLLLSGRATLRGAMEGVGKKLKAASAEGRFLGGGKMTVGAVDTFQKNIPADMAPLKQDMLRIVLQALRDYNFTSARMEVRHVPERSFLKLALDGEAGTRNLRFNFNHPPTATNALPETP
jgi:hypothetical protein